MKTEDFLFDYPEELIATEPSSPSRIMWSEPGFSPAELTKNELFQKIGPNDIVVLNDTRVEKRRVKSLEGAEFLFVQELGGDVWQVLFPAKKAKIGDQFQLPGGVILKLIEKGIPQKVSVEGRVSVSYFEQFGEMALPPYIQKMRGEQRIKSEDESWYQTDWAENSGSSAAPTASLHFSNSDWSELENRGVPVVKITLHIGLGTFLPIQVESIKDHKMHSEWVSIDKTVLQKISEAKSKGGRVWAIGTTVMRALESWAKGHFEEQGDKVCGETDIFISPGFRFEVVGGLATNFHQPGSTLIALVSAFAGLSRTKQAYGWAIKNQFRLFSYGDLSVWLPE